MTLEELQLLRLQYRFGYSAEDHALRQYVNEEHGIAKQVYTPRKKGLWGVGNAVYKLLKTGEEFDTLEGLLAAINKESA